ncbi:MAG: hypothetical protein IJW96_00685 [Clostridia bacterium]|nr:hypothetical protein [Clostridia bacterium]
MKNIGRYFLPILLAFSMVGCSTFNPNNSEEEPKPVDLNMNINYPLPTSFPKGNGEAIKVVLLLGQSNASGCSIVEYLQMTAEPEDYQRYEKGYDNILINYCIDDHAFTSNGEFVPVDLTCGSGNGFFGPEVGMADVLSKNSTEKILILKYTMSGYGLNIHWLKYGERGSIYNACQAFLSTYLTYLTAQNYQPSLRAVCWMQGESDTATKNADKYYTNQCAFASYLREDFSAYAPSTGIYFIDAGISSSPYCEPGYPTVNQAKEKFSTLSPLNIYFSTIEMGLTTLKEPYYEPDLGHYDALCEIALGQRFGEELLKIF